MYAYGLAGPGESKLVLGRVTSLHIAYVAARERDRLYDHYEWRAGGGAHWSRPGNETWPPWSISFSDSAPRWPNPRVHGAILPDPISPCDLMEISSDRRAANHSYLVLNTVHALLNASYTVSMELKQIVKQTFERARHRNNISWLGA